MAKGSLPDVEAWRLNPLIQHTPTDTMQAAACAVKAIARVIADRADWAQVAQWSDTSGPDGLLNDEVRGIGLLCECIGAALTYEIGGRVTA